MKYASLFCVILLTWTMSCSVGPSYVPPCAEVPDEWKNSQDEACEESSSQNDDVYYFEHWWKVFDDHILNKLELHALDNNRDLFVAWERIEESRGLMGIAAAALYPQLTLNPLFTNTMELIKIYFSGPLPQTVFRAHELLYFLPLNLSYEVDLWGKLRDQYDAAYYDYDAQIEDFNTTLLTLTSDLATAYYQLRAADAQLDLLQATIKTREIAFEINKDRYEGQVTFYSDVTDAGAQLESVRAQYEEVVRQRALLEDQIAVLIGVPAAEFCLEHNPLSGLPPCIPEGIPSEILTRRPDVAEAEYKVMSENALVKEAYSLFFPSLSLTTTGGSESPVARQFLKWNSRYWMIGASSNQIIFDGFRTCSNLEAEIARFKEASGEYQQTILIAFQEVEDALANLDSYAKQHSMTKAAVNWAQQSYQLYSDRYTSGVTYYIDVVNTEQILLSFQISLNNILGFRYVSTIQLIKALGGGWDSNNLEDADDEDDDGDEEEDAEDDCLCSA